MKERPILFSAQMIRAILEGRKTQTRRIFKHNIEGLEIDNVGYTAWFVKCPYGVAGDRLWVRETWRPKTHSFPTGWPYEYRATAEQYLTPTDGIWKPSIFMPREASRITLEITGIRVERVNEISEEDAIAEGIESFRPVPGDGAPETRYRNYLESRHWKLSPVESFKTLWNKINGPESLEHNPYVWVIEFKVL